MQQKNNNTVSPLSSILHIIGSYWYVFVVSIALCIGIGYLYSQNLSHVYSAQAKILIKESGDAADSEMLEEIGVNTGASSVENEIEVLKSIKLLENVVDELNLTTEYSIQPVMRKINIYGASPIAIEWFDKQTITNTSINVNILSANRYQYSINEKNKSIVRNIIDNFNPNKTDDAEYRTANFGDTVSLNGGRFVIKPTEFWGNSNSKETITVNLLSKNSRVSYLQNNLTIYRISRVTGTIHIGYVDSNSRQASDVITSLIENYNRMVVEDKNRAALNTERFIANRISLIYEDLGAIDSRLENIKRNNRVTDLGSASSTAYEQRVRYDDEVNAIDLQISLISAVRAELNRHQHGDYSQLPPNRLYTEIGIAEQITIYNSLVAKLNEISANSGRRNPVFITLAKEVQQAKDNLIIATDNIDKSLQIKKNSLTSNSQEASSKLSNLLVHEKIVNDVMREQSIKEQLYLFLLNKREANAIQIAITESNATVIEPATSSHDAISPNVLFILLISGIIGFTVPAIAIFLLLSSDNMIRTKEHIQDNSSVPVLGMIIKKPKKLKDSSIVVSNDGNDVISESFRMARGELDIINSLAKIDTKECQVMQIVSGAEGEGKTFATINLALTYAYTNKKVLVIDGDLRRKGFSKLIDNDRANGLSTYLTSDNLNIDDLIRTSEYSMNLDYIRVGTALANPVTALMSDKFEDMVTKLRSRYDIIIIDSTPYFIVVDAKVINRVADSTIWVTRAGVAKKAVINEINNVYDNSKLKNVSVLLTDVDLNNIKLNYNYSYTYDYSYTYGSSDNKKKKKK